MTFAKIAPTLRGLGYETIPLYPGKKNPSIDSWQSVVITEEKVAQWASNGKADHGVGVRTGTGQIALYGADNDFYDKNVAVKVRKSFVDHFGEGLVRVGQAPKSLMVYAGAPGATKITSPVWMSPDGREHKFEMLGAGQQFVAFGIHEKTGQEYLWPNGSILDVETWELIEIDPVKVAAWVRNVLPTLIPADWSVKGSTRGSAPLQPTDTEERRLLNYKPKLDLDWDEVRRMVLSLDASMKRDEWYRVVMAIHHQCDGADEGLDLADEWSRTGSNYKNRRDVETVWRSVEDDPARGAVVTMATVIKMLRDLAPEVKAEALAEWQARIAACDNANGLQRMTEDEMAFDPVLGDMDRVILIDTLQRRAQEITGVRPTKDVVARWLRRRGNRPMPDLNAEGRPLETEGNIKAVIDNNGIVVRYNVIKKDDEILIPGESFTIDNRRSASLTHLRGLCHQAEVPTKYLKNFVTLLADKNQYNPVVTWVTSKTWDGVSRLDDFYATVQENTEKCSHKMKVTLMRKWLISGIAAAFSPVGTAVRGVLTFQGAQYTGKTRWTMALVPKELDLVKIGKSLNVHDKDSVKQILSCWIGELGEIDSTFKRSDLAGLKAFITNDMDEMRRPYAEAESQYVRRTIFTASVNQEHFLADETGNTRFWVIPTLSLNHEHTIDMQQLWAEVLTIWQAGEVHYLTTDEMQALNSHNETFEVADPIVEMVTSHLAWDTFSPTNCHWLAVSDVLRWIGVKSPTKWETTAAGKAISKLNGGHLRRSHGKRLTAVPLQRRLINFEGITEMGSPSDIDGDTVVDDSDPANLQF